MLTKSKITSRTISYSNYSSRALVKKCAHYLFKTSGEDYLFGKGRREKNEKRIYKTSSEFRSFWMIALGKMALMKKRDEKEVGRGAGLWGLIFISLFFL